MLQFGKVAILYLKFSLMYSQSLSYQSSNSLKPSKGKKSSKSQINTFIERFNQISRNKHLFTASSLFDQTVNLMMEFIRFLSLLEKRKEFFEAVIHSNLALGVNSRNKHIVLFHVKLIELYLRYQLDLRKILKSEELLRDYLLLERQFPQKFGIKIASIPNLKDSKLKSVVERAAAFMFKYVQIEETEKHMKALNFYLNQALQIQNFNIFYQIISAYFQALKDRPFKCPFIEINTVLKTFFDFPQASEKQFEPQCIAILKKYVDILYIPNYIPHLMKNFNVVFQLITGYADSNPNKQTDFIITFLYNFLMDCLDQGTIFPIPQFDIQPYKISSINQKIFVFYSFYQETFKNPKIRTFEDFELWKIDHFEEIIRKNINNLIHSDHNFVRIVDKIANKIQSLKTHLLKEITSNEKLMLYRNAKGQKTIQIMKKLVQIQSHIISNQNYLAIDNFRNANYFATSGLFEIKVEFLKIDDYEKSCKIQKVIKKWIQKISTLNLENQDIEIFYCQILTMHAKMLSSFKNPNQISIVLKNIEVIIGSIPDFLGRENKILMIWSYILQRLIAYFQQKIANNETGHEYFTEIKGIDRFTKNFSEFTLENGLNYFKFMWQQRNENKQSQKMDQQIQIINKSIVAFSLNYQSVSEKDQEKFISVLSKGLQFSSIGDFQQFVYSQIVQDFEEFISTTIQTKKNFEEANQYFQIDFTLDMYRKIVKIFASKKKTTYEQSSLNILKRVNFIMHLKQIIGIERKNSSLLQLVQKTEQTILGNTSRQYIQSFKFDGKTLNQSKQVKLEILLDILIKKVYFITHPQTHIDYGFNSTFGKSNAFDTEEGKNADQAPKKTRRQMRQNESKNFENYVIAFESSCMAIGKAKNLLLEFLPKLIKQINEYDCIEIDNFEVVDFRNEHVQKFDNPLNLLGYTWNLLWMLRISDMKNEIMEILKLRLGILHYFSRQFRNPNILQYEIDKLRYFGLINTTKSFFKINSTFKAAEKTFEHKLLLNQINESDIDHIKSKIQTIIFLLNNFPSSKNFKILISYISNLIFDLTKYSQTSLANVKVKFFPFLNESFHYRKKSFQNNKKSIEKCMMEINPQEVRYPLMTLILRKLMFLVKKHNQISEMRSLLSIITCYFSKIGLGLYFDEVVEIWLMRNVKLNILKVVDCYHILVNNSLKSGDSMKNGQKMKTFEKIDKMLCNKRRSVSVYFTLKGIIDVVEQLKRSEISMNYSINRIILQQFREQFNLYKYEVEAILQKVYGHQRSYEFQQYSLEDKQKLKKVQEIARKIVFQKELFKVSNIQGFNYTVSSLKYMLENLPQLIAIHFQSGQTAQSLIGYMIEYLYEFTPQQLKPVHPLIDQLILSISVSMIDFNYEFKTLIYESEDIENLHKDQLITIYNKLQYNKTLFSKFYSSYKTQISSKINFLKSSGKSKFYANNSNALSYPLSIIYPLRNHVYNITVLGDVLITKVDCFNFDQNLSTIEQFIDNDSDILMKQKSVNDWWKARTRLNRQMGKIAECTDLGIFDTQPEPTTKIKNQYSKKLCKFIPFIQDDIKAHLKDFFEKESIQAKKQIEIKNQLEISSQLQMISAAQTNGYNKIKQNILILTLNRFSIYPFEKVKLLSKYNGVYRVPSVRYIMEQQKIRQKKSNIYNVRNLAYVINPSKDLISTEKSFLQIQQKIYKKAKIPLQWQGIMSKKPTYSQFNYSFSKQVYIYMGHGSGMSHIREKQFYQTPVNTVTMLFGCSSINMEHRCSELHGIPLIFLKNHCPALLGANWEVTDKDTDCMTAKMFELIGNQKEIDFSYCLQQAKKQMRLPNLNGCAIVVYGLPVKLILE